jgi:hypothetical protein
LEESGQQDIDGSHAMRKANDDRCPTDSDTRRGLLSRRGVACGTPQHVSADRGHTAHDGASPLALTRPVDGGTGDPEQVGELSGAVLAAIK